MASPEGKREKRAWKAKAAETWRKWMKMQKYINNIFIVSLHLHSLLNSGFFTVSVLGGCLDDANKICTVGPKENTKKRKQQGAHCHHRRVWISTWCEKESHMVSQICANSIEGPFHTGCMWSNKIYHSQMTPSVKELICGFVSRKSFKLTVCCHQSCESLVWRRPNLS